MAPRVLPRRYGNGRWPYDDSGPLPERVSMHRNSSHLQLLL